MSPPLSKSWANSASWDQYKRIITELYETYTLKEVAEIMETKHNFYATCVTPVD